VNTVMPPGSMEFYETCFLCTVSLYSLMPKRSY
jgi:hypothetical protein